MKEYYYTGDFAGRELVFAFRHSDTASYFKDYLRALEMPVSENAVRVPKSDCDCWIRDYGMGDDGNTEFGMSVYRASDALLSSGRVILHAAAMLWQGKAYLFSADSGTGKSTQLRRWLQLYGHEVKIINGDKPILHSEGNGRFTVHSSPWKGKEEWGEDTLSAPLGGIILLKQGPENKISRLPSSRAAACLLPQFFSSFENRKHLFMLCRLEETLLSETPVWLLVNKGDAASAKLTRETLLREAANGL